MKKIESFKTFSQIQNQIREEARQKEIASKREASVAAFNELLSKYNASSIEDLNEEDRDAFMTELTAEGNAFGAARAEAIAKGEDSFKVGDEEMPVKNVDKEDEENAEEFANESYEVELFWKGLSGDEAKIGKFLVSKKDYEKLEDNFAGDIEFDLYDDTAKGKVVKYNDVITAMRNTKYGKTAMESVITEGKYDDILDKVEAAVKDASNFMNVGIALKDAGIKYDFSTGMMPIYRLKKHPIAIVNKKYVDKGDREVGDIAIGVMESLTESLLTEALEGKSQKEAMKGYAAIHKFMMAHPAFNTKTISDQTVAWFMRTALKEALMNVNYHNEAAKVGRAINFAGFSEPVIFLKEMGGMPLPIKRGMMQDKAYDLALAMSKGAKYNGYAIIEAVAMFFDDRFPKTSVAANLRAMLDKFMGEAVEIGNLEQKINEGSAFNTARLKAIEAGEDEFEFDGKTYPVKNVDKEDKELAKELVDEGSAFNTARLKAIEAGEDEFEFDGKTYPVTNVDKEDKELAKELTERLDNSTMKRMSGLTDQKELKNFKQAFVNLAQAFYEEGFEYDEVLEYISAVLRDPNIRGSIEEGNAFLGARAKAIEEDAEEFEFNGKTYPVTVKEATEVVEEGYAERKMDDMREFVKKAENKRVRLSITEGGQTNVIEDRLKKGSYGLHKIDFMGFDFEDEIKAVENEDSFIMGVRPGQFLKWKVGSGKYGTEYLIEVL